jgi:hypothetical protein
MTSRSFGVQPTTGTNRMPTSDLVNKLSQTECKSRWILPQASSDDWSGRLCLSHVEANSLNLFEHSIWCLVKPPSLAANAIVNGKRTFVNLASSRAGGRVLQAEFNGSWIESSPSHIVRVIPATPEAAERASGAEAGLEYRQITHEMLAQYLSLLVMLPFANRLNNNPGYLQSPHRSPGAQNYPARSLFPGARHERTRFERGPSELFTTNCRSFSNENEPSAARAGNPVLQFPSDGIDHKVTYRWCLEWSFKEVSLARFIECGINGLDLMGVKNYVVTASNLVSYRRATLATLTGHC